MITFEDIWRVLYEHGASSKQEEGTRRYWAGLRPEQQEQVFTTITTKLREGKFVWYDPIRAIKENLRRVRVPADEPVNYNRKAIPAGVKVFSAKYKGAWGMYTQADIERFGMEKAG